MKGLNPSEAWTAIIVFFVVLILFFSAGKFVINQEKKNVQYKERSKKRDYQSGGKL